MHPLLAQRMQPATPAPTQRFVTAASQRGLISFDGRSPTSPAYFGGSAYVVMCRSCGLEPIGRPGYHSNCICCCKTCSRLLNGRGNLERLCDMCSGSVTHETVPIGTTHIKAKPARPAAGAGTAPNSVRAVRADVAGEGGGGAAVTHVDDDEDDPPIWLQRYMRMNAATSAVTAGCFCGLPGEATSCDVCALCVPS